MSNSATTITSPTGSKIRVVEINGELWFVARDVCTALGLNIIGGVHQHLEKLASDERARSRVLGMRGSQANLVSESGLYKLVLRSDKAKAKAFQHWVTRDVLPAIRKDRPADALAGLFKVRFPMAPDYPPEPSGEPPEVTEMRRFLGL